MVWRSQYDWAFLIKFRERCLVDNLKAMLRIPTLAEENRLKYIKILQEAREKERRKTIESPKEAIKENAEIDSMKDKLCHCFGSRPKSDLICRCAPPTNLHTEPEQLYFDK